jgi:hypothetical protein
VRVGVIVDLATRAVAARDRFLRCGGHRHGLPVQGLGELVEAWPESAGRVAGGHVGHRLASGLDDHLAQGLDMGEALVPRCGRLDSRRTAEMPPRSALGSPGVGTRTMCRATDAASRWPRCFHQQPAFWSPARSWEPSMASTSRPPIDRPVSTCSMSPRNVTAPRPRPRRDGDSHRRDALGVPEPAGFVTVSFSFSIQSTTLSIGLRDGLVGALTG